MQDFQGLDLAPSLLAALSAQGIVRPTPIQAQSIPPLMEGRDMLGIAQTGTGKTAAFALPLLHRLASNPAGRHARRPRALILAPTRELALQIGQSMRDLAARLPIQIATVYGGANIRTQMRTLARGVDVLVATPGRLLDLMGQGHADLGAVEVFVLDEADRMLDMGFIGDVRRIAKTIPTDRQTALFSATLPAAVEGLAESLLNEPVRVSVAPTATTADNVDQHVLFVAKANKRDLVSDLMADRALSRVLIFTRTKHGADRVARHLDKCGIAADAIHGNKSQNNRQRALARFRDGQVRALVATDIAARGIDVADISHVINFDLPVDPESYVHRIGRTARAGATGIALSLCDRDERDALRDIERSIRQDLQVNAGHAFHDEAIATATNGSAGPGKNRSARPGKPAHKGQAARPANGDGQPARRRRRRHRGPARQAA